MRNLPFQFERRDPTSREQRFISWIGDASRLTFVFLERVAIVAALRVAASESRWVMAAYWIALCLLTAPIGLWAQRFAVKVRVVRISGLRQRLTVFGYGAVWATAWFAAIMGINWFATEVVVAIVTATLRQSG